jgi:hypothetical protein
MTLHSEQCSCRSGLRQSAARIPGAAMAHHLPPDAAPQIVKIYTQWLAKTLQDPDSGTISRSSWTASRRRSPRKVKKRFEICRKIRWWSRATKELAHAGALPWR